jgi:DNA-binding beta-propeller fold protein YncE
MFFAGLLAGPGISRADIIYVANAGSHVLTTYDLGTGAYLGFLPTGDLGQPQGVAFGSAGNLYMADSYFSRSERIYPGGGMSAFASSTSGPDEPHGLAID